ncbi:MAG: hypothetical protein HXX13_17590 [Bacteroidetes bacterium]|nr:hypothetical protein [Bacteroidota bacterium]
MKSFSLLAVLTVILLLEACSKMDKSTNSYPASLMEVTQILDSTQIKFIDFARNNHGNPWDAITSTTEWLKTLANIESASAIDSVYISIKLKSGLTTVFSFNQVDNQGYSVYRGGGKPKNSGAYLKSSTTKSKNTITNKKVLIFSPVTNDFYAPGELGKIESLLNSSSVGLDVTVLKDSQCTYDVVDSFKDYGLVILDTHGGYAPFYFQGGNVIDLTNVPATQAAINAAVSADLGTSGYAKLLSGELLLTSSINVNPGSPGWQTNAAVVKLYEVSIDAKYIEDGPSLSNTIIFGNFCWGGHTKPGTSFGTTYNPIEPAFMNKNLITYFSYTDSAGNGSSMSNNFCKEMEDSLVRSLVIDYDSTRLEHLTKYWDKEIMPPIGRIKRRVFFKSFGADDYSYAKCGEPFTDPRDGQVYQTVCFGKHQWMAQNLNYNAAGSITYDNDPYNGSIYGRLYDWTTLMQGADSSSLNPSGVRGVCPQGWHIPSNREFAVMVGLFGGSQLAGGALKSTSPLWNSPNTGATNSSGFSGLPGGYAYEGTYPITFYSLGDASQFATSTRSLNGTNAIVWILSSSDGATGSTGSALLGSNSVRCVKDD